jgi:tetratricopeptide (TPR) repeat protein
VHDALTSGEGQAVGIVAAQAIHGLGGVGKTRLAVEYAWKYSEEYTALLFVRADSPENLETNLAGLCAVLGFPEAEASDQETQVRALKGWLAENSGWLLILDNVDDRVAALAVSRLADSLQGGRVLITGRWSSFGRAVQTLELDVLDEDAAVEYLLEDTEGKRHKTGTDENEARELAARLEQLAVALEQAASWIRCNRSTLAAYRAKFDQNFEEVAGWHDEMTMDYPESVAAAWVTTVNALTEPARTLLNALSWLASDPIPAFVFESEQSAVAELADYSMIKWDGKSGTIQVHRLVQEITRSRLGDESRRATIEAALAAVNAAAPTDSDDVRTWPVWDPLRPHVSALVAHADQHAITDPTTRLIACLASLLHTKALHAEAEPLYRRALEIDEQSYGPGHPKVATRLNNLAQLLKATNRLEEAEPLMRRHVEIFRKFGEATGHEHPHWRAALQNYLGLLAEMGLSEEEAERKVLSVASPPGAVEAE